MDLHSNSMYFKTESTPTKKIFKLTLPLDLVFTIKWDKDELKELKEFNDSTLISDKIKMMALYAEKAEALTDEEVPSE